MPSDQSLHAFAFGQQMRKGHRTAQGMDPQGLGHIAPLHTKLHTLVGQLWNNGGAQKGITDFEDRLVQSICDLIFCRIRLQIEQSVSL